MRWRYLPHDHLGVLFLFREERSKFIRLKYTDRKFMVEDDEVDAEVELAGLKQTDSDDEKLLEDSGEVNI